MKNKNSLELSDVQMKVIDELDLLTDAFVSTFNEIGKKINAFSEGISIIIEKLIKEKSHWREYNNRCFDLSYMPFREYSIEKKFAIESLKQYFNVGGQKILVKEVMVDNKKKQVDDLELYWGFTYDIEDDPAKFFYFELWKIKKSEGAIFSKNEYDNFAKEMKELCGIKEDNFFEIVHPDDEDSEYFSVWLDFKYLDKLSDFFQICKEGIIEKLITKIKD